MSELTQPQQVGDEDPTMRQCMAWAHATYARDGVLSHERVADDLARFLFDRLQDQPPSTTRNALASVINKDYHTATYISCGRKSIIVALARLCRLALPYADVEGYREEWRP